MHLRFTNVNVVNGAFEADVEITSGPSPIPITPPDEPDEPGPLPSPDLPVGWNSDTAVAFKMLVSSMQKHGLTPVGVQGHGQAICDALNADYPWLNAYADKRSDAVMWPGFGDIDVTIDSGKGGWSFQPGHNAPYEPDPAKR